MNLKRFIQTFAVFSALVLGSVQARAQETLILIVDVSSSITMKELDLQLSSYERAMNTVAGLGLLNIEVILFGEVPEHISSGSVQNAAAAFASYPRTPSTVRGSTCLGKALLRAQRIVQSRLAHTIIDISGDGGPNCEYKQTGVHKILDEIAQYGTQVNTLYIDQGPTSFHAAESGKKSSVELFYESMTRNDGFMETASDFYDFEMALFNKLSLEFVQFQEK